MLDEAERNGAVEIRRRDGTAFRILPLRTGAAPLLDVKGVKVKVSAGDLAAIVRERAASADRSLPILGMGNVPRGPALSW